MPVQVFSTDEFHSLVKACRDRFEGSGWLIMPGKTEYADFEIRTRQLILLVKCLDLSVWKYKSPERVVDQIRSDTVHMKRTAGRTLIWIIEFGVSGVTPSGIWNYRAITFAPQEISLVNELMTIQADSIRSLEFRQEAILSSNTWECIRISDFCKQSGDLDGAFQWMRRGVEVATGKSPARWRLLKMLIQDGQLEEAEAFAKQDLQHNSQAAEFAAEMKKVFERSGDIQRAEWWKEKIDTVKGKNIEPKSFDEFMKRRGMEASPRTGGADTGQDVSSRSMISRIRSFLLK